MQNLLSALAGEEERLDTLLTMRMRGYEAKLDGLSARLFTLSPGEKIKRESSALSSLRTRLLLAAQNGIHWKEERFGKAVSAMEAMSPLAVLTRGYSITMNEYGEIIRSAGELLPGALIRTMLPDGELLSVVQQTKRKAETEGVQKSRKKS